MKVIGIVGSRKRNGTKDFDRILQEFLKVYEVGDWICSGGCSKGADRFAEIISQENGIPILIFNANWKEYGRNAGLIRNTNIAKHSTILIARIRKDRKGGTEDTIKKFKKFYPDRQIILVED